MKALKALVVCSLLLVGSQSFAHITPIKFAKGSSCGSFSGNASGRTFTLQLNANQVLIISSYDFYADTRDTIVKNPQGKTLQGTGLPDGILYDTNTKGKYTIKVIPTSNHIDLEFCAY